MRGAKGPSFGWAVACLVLLAVTPSWASEPRPEDNRTFRPTVLIRKGRAQGSGTIVSSVSNETLVLTAAHVVTESGPLFVELHRYNLGVERSRTSETWPRLVEAEVEASDRASDLAVLRVRGMVALPYVARITPVTDAPARGTAVTSVGIDLGTRLSSWTTQVRNVERFAMEGGGAERQFLVTNRAPEHGRSGGGLFLDNGELIGVCIGRAEIVEGHRSGIFASTASIRRLLHESDLEAVVAHPKGPVRRTPITTTRSRPSR